VIEVRKQLVTIKEDLIDRKWSLIGLGILIGLLVYYVVYMLDSMDLDQMQAYLDNLPDSVKALLGELDIANPYSMTSAYTFSFLWLYCGIYLIYMAGSLVPQEVENHTLDMILSKPVSREEYLSWKIIFLYIFITSLMGLISLFMAAGMTSSTVFSEEELHWGRLCGVFFISVLHLGTLTIIAVFFSAILLNTKKTIAVSLIALFVMFFIGSSYGPMGPAVGGPIRYISTWSYYKPEQVFGAGDFSSFALDVTVLVIINMVLVLSSLLLFRKRDIPV
jgi:ABC-2 type transport system permease protein